MLLILFISFTSIIFFPIAIVLWLVTYPFDRQTHLLHLFTCFWASLYIWSFPPWSVSVTGREQIDPKQAYIIVSNHQSVVDILVAFTLFIHFKWVSKEEMFHWPLIGWNMSLNRYVRLRRGKMSSVRGMFVPVRNICAEAVLFTCFQKAPDPPPVNYDLLKKVLSFSQNAWICRSYRLS